MGIRFRILSRHFNAAADTRVAIADELCRRIETMAHWEWWCSDNRHVLIISQLCSSKLLMHLLLVRATTVNASFATARGGIMKIR